MGIERYPVLGGFTDECGLPNRFRIELMLRESVGIGRLDFPGSAGREARRYFDEANFRLRGSTQ